ncbi:hypothetical protein EYR41_001883 [Orbilia oligospora]|uniref:Uncharacterized protein n=1 Tax=Orbilia oligospora TaxID=2813651 RepID=A0A7C8KIU6_ORBOL|nr:hypothetical protein TWF751_006906 [Orbilia oligospora]TGJ74926.1 hypothetical protein EYR41_001883 [Orbilia oligospora]
MLGASESSVVPAIEAALTRVNEALANTPWASELAGVLPLTGFIDFIDTPTKLHIFELFGAVPLWSWPITPGDIRLLLSDAYLHSICCLDRFGSSLAWHALDGRWGDAYPIINPETTRLCLASQPITQIPNEHANMFEKNLRIQKLSIVHVTRSPGTDRIPSDNWLRFLFVDPFWMYSARYFATSIMGWFLLVGLAVFCAMFRYYIALTFLLIMPVTGLVVSLIYGSRPKALLVDRPSPFNRAVVVAEHMNATEWTVFYGESSIINSLLNKQLESRRRPLPKKGYVLLRFLLRLFTLGQWAMVLASLTLKDMNAFVVATWIIICVLSQTYLYPPECAAKTWMKKIGRIEMKRYETETSSRRALLNTIMALNPDTFAEGTWEQLYSGALKWINPILEAGQSRSDWEEATRAAMEEASEIPVEELAAAKSLEVESGFLSETWNEANERFYWKKFIHEGIYLASKVMKEGGLPGRRVTPRSEQTAPIATQKTAVAK